MENRKIVMTNVQDADGEDGIKISVIATSLIDAMTTLPGVSVNSAIEIDLRSTHIWVLSGDFEIRFEIARTENLQSGLRVMCCGHVRGPFRLLRSA